MARINDLGRDPVRSLVLRLAIPSMLAQWVNVLYSIVDRMYIGNIAKVGAVALAGAGVCGPIVTLISSFAFLVGVGGAPLLAMRLGEGNEEGARKILANCTLMLGSLAVLLTAIALMLRRPLLGWFGASDATFAYAETYLTIYVCGTLFAILATGLNQFIICQGFSTIGMTSVLVGAGLNILLDPLFIFVFDMGIAGAAFATIISQFASCVFVVAFLMSSRVRIRITFGGYTWRVVRRVLAFGFSPFLIIATDSIILIVLNSVLQRYGGPQQGDMYITCATIVQSYMQLVTMPLGGITSGTQPVLSFNYGANHIDRIKQSFGWIFTVAVAFTAVMLLLSQLVPQFFVGIFTQDAAYMQLSIWGIRIFTSGIVILALQYTVVDGLTALGIAPVAITLSLLRKSTFLVCTIVLPLFFGARGAFFAEPICDIACGLISTAVFALSFGKLMQKRMGIPKGQELYA